MLPDWARSVLSLAFLFLVAFATAGNRLPLFIAIMVSAALAIAALQLLFPVGRLFSIAFANLIAVYAAIFSLFVEEVFGGVDPALLSLGFSLPIFAFVAGCWFRREQVRAVVAHPALRSERRMLGAFLWLFPTFVVGGGVLLFARGGAGRQHRGGADRRHDADRTDRVLGEPRRRRLPRRRGPAVRGVLLPHPAAGDPGLRLSHLLFAAHHPVRLGLPHPLAIHRQAPFLRRRGAAGLELLGIRSISPSSASAPSAMATSFRIRAWRACSPRSRWCAASCCSCSACRSFSNIPASIAERTATSAVRAPVTALISEAVAPVNAPPALKQRSDSASVNAPPALKQRSDSASVNAPPALKQRSGSASIKQ